MILTTTPTVEGKLIAAYLGPVGAEVIMGANFWKDAGGRVADFLGGRATDYEQEFGTAREIATKEIRMKASMLGATAIVGLRFDYQILGENNGMMMVAATGTAVQLILNREEQARVDGAQKAFAAMDDADYYLDLHGKTRGPFSVNQLTQLVADGKIPPDAVTTNAAGIPGKTVGDLIA